MDLDDILVEVCRRTPQCIGAVLCDYDGECVVTALGDAPPPPEAHACAQEHVPRALRLETPVAEFLMKLCGAEPCGLLRELAEPAQRLGAGALGAIHFRYARVEVLVHRLVDEYYVVLVQKRPATPGPGQRALRWAEGELRPHLV